MQYSQKRYPVLFSSELIRDIATTGSRYMYVQLPTDSTSSCLMCEPTEEGGSAGNETVSQTVAGGEVLEWWRSRELKLTDTP